MGLAFTQSYDANNKIVRETIAIPETDTNGESLIAALDAIVVSAGWERLGVFGNGYEYLVTSPQLLTCHCRIYKPDEWVSGALVHAIAIQILSTDGNRLGRKHPIYFHGQAAADYTQLSVWANKCQLFTYRPGIGPPTGSSEDPGWCFHGGIPFSPALIIAGAECSPNPALPLTACAEMWWSASEGQGAGGYTGRPCLRNTLRLFDGYSVCYNGLLQSRTLAASEPLARNPGSPLIPFAIPGIPGSSRFAGPTCPGLVWTDGQTPLYLDPLIAWGESLGSRPIIRGQLWDAVVGTKRVVYDASVTLGTNDSTGLPMVWSNYMYGGESSGDGLAHIPSLLLLIDPGNQTSGDVIENIAY
jgi:hypothetical protein